MRPLRRSRSVACLLIVAGFGLVAGLGWKFGWISVEVATTETGELSETATVIPASVVHEPADPPMDDPFLIAAQAEPPVQEGENFATLPPPSQSDAPPQDLDVPESVVVPPPVTPSKPLPVESPTMVDASYETVNAGGTITPTANEVEQPANPPEEFNLTEIQRLMDLGDYLAAHRELSKVYWNRPELRPVIRELLDKTAQAIFFAPQPHYLEPYVVQPGDRLGSIAAKYRVSWQYLAKLNGISDPARIRVGQKLKVIRGPFAAVVDLHDFALTVHLQGYVVKRYPVGIGKDGSSPLGKFTVLEKLENPQYTDPEGRVIEADDPSNPLGERWLDLGDSYGIHGTIDPSSIGQAASRGCIRMLNSDVEEVYDLLTVGSEVTIRP